MRPKDSWPISDAYVGEVNGLSRYSVDSEKLEDRLIIDAGILSGWEYVVFTRLTKDSVGDFSEKTFSGTNHLWIVKHWFWFPEEAIIFYMRPLRERGGYLCVELMRPINGFQDNFFPPDHLSLADAVSEAAKQYENITGGLHERRN